MIPVALVVHMLLILRDNTGLGCRIYQGTYTLCLNSAVSLLPYEDFSRTEKTGGRVSTILFCPVLVTESQFWWAAVARNLILFSLS